MWYVSQSEIVQHLKKLYQDWDIKQFFKTTSEMSLCEPRASFYNVKLASEYSKCHYWPAYLRCQSHINKYQGLTCYSGTLPRPWGSLVIKLLLIMLKSLVRFPIRVMCEDCSCLMASHVLNFAKSSIKTKLTHIFLKRFNSAENSFEEGEVSVRQLLSNSTIPFSDILFAYQLYFSITDNLQILQHTYSISAVVSSLPWDQTGAKKLFKHLCLAHKNCVCVLVEFGDNISVDGVRFLCFLSGWECWCVVSLRGVQLTCRCLVRRTRGKQNVLRCL